jgi:hypothetical protein
MFFGFYTEGSTFFRFLNNLATNTTARPCEKGRAVVFVAAFNVGEVSNLADVLYQLRILQFFNN